MTRPLKGHWGNRSLKDYLFQVSSQVVTQVLEIMELEQIGRSKFAKRLGVSKGRVSQILNHPGNLSLESIVRYARRLDRKVAIVLYDDGDPRNKKGSVLPQIFVASWKQSGEPRNFFELNDPRATRNLVVFNKDWASHPGTDHPYGLGHLVGGAVSPTSANVPNFPVPVVFEDETGETIQRTGTHG